MAHGKEALLEDHLLGSALGRVSSSGGGPHEVVVVGGLAEVGSLRLLLLGLQSVKVLLVAEGVGEGVGGARGLVRGGSGSRGGGGRALAAGAVDVVLEKVVATLVVREEHLDEGPRPRGGDRVVVAFVVGSDGRRVGRGVLVNVVVAGGILRSGWRCEELPTNGILARGRGGDGPVVVVLHHLSSPMIVARSPPRKLSRRRLRSRSRRRGVVCR